MRKISPLSGITGIITMQGFTDEMQLKYERVGIQISRQLSMIVLKSTCYSYAYRP